MKRIVVAFLLSIPFFSFAGTGTGKVIGYIPFSSGSEEVFFIKVENLSNSPDCNNSSRFTMKSSDPKFKATQAAVLAALMSGMEVRATGLGTCNHFSNSEDLQYICLGNIPC